MVQKNKQPGKTRHGAIALLEFESIAAGVKASDLMVKHSPIALLRCGTIHPGRFLILVGGSVASTQEAYAVGMQLGEAERSLSDSVLLGDVHPALHDAVLGKRKDLSGDALAVVARGGHFLLRCGRLHCPGVRCDWTSRVA